MKYKKKTKANAGETLVEVVASLFIFLIMMGILQGAIAYSHTALEKNKEIRKNNAAVLQGLQSDVATNQGEVRAIAFRATDTNFTNLGEQVFVVDTQLNSKTISYIDAQNEQKEIIFYLYGTQAAGGHAEGGGTP